VSFGGEATICALAGTTAELGRRSPVHLGPSVPLDRPRFHCLPVTMKPHSHDIELSAGCGRRQHAPNRRPSRRAAPPPSNRRSPGGDERGVEAVVGAILLFALVVLMISIVQVSAVPAWNQQIEFEHSQRVQDDAGDLDAAISRVLSTGTGEAVSVELGTRYPPRAFLLNPPSVSGTLDSRDLGTITISNVQALDPEADDYWRSPGAGSYDTNVVVYDPNYNEYRNPPMVVFEHSALYSEFDGGEVVPIDSGQLVNGNRITIVTLDGDYSAAQVESASVEIVPLSAPMKSIAVTSRDGNNIVLTVPTRLTATEWNEMLSEELTSNGGNVVSVNDAGPGSVSIALRGDVTYTLRMAKIGVGTGFTESQPGYLTIPSGQSRSADEDTTAIFTFEVRDKFNNPINRDVTVNVTLVDNNVNLPQTISSQGKIDSGSGILNLTGLKPDQNGQVTVSYTVSNFNGSDIAAQLRASLDDSERLSFAPRNPEDVVFNFTRVNSDKSGVVTGSEFTLNTREPGKVWLIDSVLTNDQCNNANPCNVTVSFQNTNTDYQNITAVRINSYAADTFNRGFNNSPPDTMILTNVDESSTVVIPYPGNFVNGNYQAFDPNELDIFDFSFKRSSDQFGVEPGDTFIITIAFEDGSQELYLIVPREPT